jgi:hypothetical protein
MLHALVVVLLASQTINAASLLNTNQNSQLEDYGNAELVRSFSETKDSGDSGNTNFMLRLARTLLQQHKKKPDIAGDISSELPVAVDEYFVEAPSKIKRSYNKAAAANKFLNFLGTTTNKYKRGFQIQTYYDLLLRNDGSIMLIPKDVNRNHYFIGKK